ncbi:MAG: hypothetical protein VW547_02055 [Alphaproteobacteria bacterium]
MTARPFDKRKFRLCLCLDEFDLPMEPDETPDDTWITVGDFLDRLDGAESLTDG